MTKRITIIQGHPDSKTEHLIHQLAHAYQSGAESAGHEVRIIEVAKLNFKLLSSEEEFETESPCEDIRQAQEMIQWADHIVIFYPLWLGTMPAILKGFWEQALRPGFALKTGNRNQLPEKLLKGRSARIIITMGMPAFIYRWFYCAHSLKNLKRNILSFSGFSPIKDTLIGAVGNLKEKQYNQLLEKMQQLGKDAQ